MDSDRIDARQALDLFRNAPMLELMARAHELRMAKHPGNEVTFAIDTNPNYTNICVTQCAFCSFFRPSGHPEAYVLSPEEVGEKARRAQQQGATTVLLQGGHHPDLRLAYYLGLISAIRAAAPGMHLHLFSPTEIAHIASVEGISWDTVLERFFEAGMRTLPGGGAEILSERVRGKISPKKISARDWLRIMGIAHRIGFQTSATMTYGHIESDEELVEHLLQLRDLQDETGGFYAFIPWSFKPGSSRLARRVPQAALPSAYVRVIALSRIVLDNFPHVQASWFSEGWRAGQLALNAGADDFGGLLLEENVLRQAHHAVATTLQNAVVLIQEAGFVPVQRTALYEKIQSVFDFGIPGEDPVHVRVSG